MEAAAVWRRCDLHNHTTPNERDASALDAHAFVKACLADDLDVVAVTDHDSVLHVRQVVSAASGTPLVVVPGVEIATSYGDILLLVPGAENIDVLDEIAVKLSLRPGYRPSFDDVVRVATRDDRPSGEPYGNYTVLVGAHVDRPGSLYGGSSAMGAAAQMAAAGLLHALEVADDEVFKEWRKGWIKGQPNTVALVRGSDSHSLTPRRSGHTWIYLPEVTAPDLRHAFVTPEASLRFGAESPRQPEFRVLSLEIVGGPYGGLRLDFHPRMNALIGPPSSGKSLVVDALRFAFGLEGALADLAEASRARLAACLPAGSEVVVRYVQDGREEELRRTFGGSGTVAPDQVPLVFGQNELVRRAMETQPAISLVDSHCAEYATTVEALNDVATNLRSTFLDAMRLAREVAARREHVLNEHDGLHAARRALDELAEVAGPATDAADFERLAKWRDAALSIVGQWNTALDVPRPPAMPRVPRIEGTYGGRMEDLVPSEAIAAALSDFSRTVTDAGSEVVRRITEAIGAAAAVAAPLELQARENLTDPSLGNPEELLEEFARRRQRLTDLEELNSELVQWELDLERRRETLRAQIGQMQVLRKALRRARWQTCSRLGGSIRDFELLVAEEAVVIRLEAALNEVKTGTRLRQDRVAELRSGLDRERLLERALDCAMGAAVPEGPGVLGEQDRVCAEGVRRSADEMLAEILTTWPGDGLRIRTKGAPLASRREFGELTEGLRALAIKEVSFALSDIPIITDQPEDAVPTQAIYERLVPTLRGQRNRRQIILASHDANIVVGADVERIFVFDGERGSTPKTGTLFDRGVRDASIELLEGGTEAFARRSARYRTLSS